MKKRIVCILALCAVFAAAAAFHRPAPVILATRAPGEAAPTPALAPSERSAPRMSGALSFALRAFGTPSYWELRTAEACEELKNLSLIRMDEGTLTVDLCEIAAVFPNLERLYISGIPVEITGEPAGWTELKSLKLTNCGVSDMETLRGVLAGCTSLKEEDIDLS